MAFISVRPTTPPRGRAINQYLGRCRQRRTATVSTNGFSLLRGWWKRARNSRIRSLYKLAPYFDASTRVGGSQRKVDGGLADGICSFQSSRDLLVIELDARLHFTALWYLIDRGSVRSGWNYREWQVLCVRMTTVIMTLTTTTTIASRRTVILFRLEAFY